MPQTIVFALGYPNLCTEADTYSGGSWQSAAPVSNVGTRALGETARSTNANTSSTKIQIDHASAKSARVLGIHRHNLSSAATLTWKRGTSAGGSQVVTSGSLSAWRMTPTDYDGEYFDVWIVLPAASSARYETIEIVDTGNAAGYVEIGRVSICPVFTPEWNTNYGLRNAHDDLSTGSEAEAGADWPDDRRRLRKASFVLDWLSGAEGDTVYEMERTLGKFGEIQYLPDLATPATLQRYGFLGTLRELSGVEYPRVSTRSMGFAMRQRG